MRPLTRPAGSSWTMTVPMRKRESWTVSGGSSERRMCRMEIFAFDWAARIFAGSLKAGIGEDIFKRAQRTGFSEDHRRKANRDIRDFGGESWRRKGTREPLSDDWRGQNRARCASASRRFHGLRWVRALPCAGARCDPGIGDRLGESEARPRWLRNDEPLRCG